MEEKVVIYDPDSSYARNLACALSESEQFSYQGIAVDTSQELSEYIDDESVRWFFLNYLCLDEEILKKRKNRCIVLMETDGYDFLDGIPALYKFRAVDRLLEQILEIESLSRKELPKEKELSREATSNICYIGTASPSERSMMTSFCLTLGQLLQENISVLYVSLETCSGFDAFFNEPCETSLSDLLYDTEISSQVDPLTGEWKQYTRNFHGMEILPPVRMPEDLYLSDPQIIRNVISSYAEAHHFGIVILDLSNDFRLMDAFFPLCRKIYIPTRNDELSRKRAEIFRDWIIRQFGERFLSCTEEIIPPAYRSLMSGRNYAEQLLFGEMGEFVRRLLGGYY